MRERERQLLNELNRLKGFPIGHCSNRAIMVMHMKRSHDAHWKWQKEKDRIDALIRGVSLPSEYMK